MKKILRLFMIALLLCTMVVTQIPLNGFMVIAAKEQTKTTDDYSDTTTYRSPESIYFSAKAAGDLEQFDTAPIYDVKSNKMLLPRIEGYTVELFGSDRKETIDLKGNVTRPLNTQTVKLLYKITNKKDGTVVTTEKNALIKIPAQALSFTGTNEKPNVIPSLREWAGGNGNIKVTEGSIVIADEALRGMAETFKADFQDITGRSRNIVTGDETSLENGDIYFTLDDKLTALNKEGYYIEFGGNDASHDYVIVRANQKTGAVYGGVSILQILKQDEGRDDLPKGITRDYPAFERRGMMLDAARKWFSMTYIKDLTKQMQWYKLNMFSIHLSDNDIWNSLSTDGGTEPEGFFRLESESFPGLTSKQHYTKAEFAAYQQYAMDLGVNVIPELDTPGHALSYTNLWPDLALPDNIANHKKYLDVTKPEVLENMKIIFDEYINGYNGGPATFIGPDVNIGTDEFKVSGQAYKEAFRAYCDALLKYVREQGKEPVFWGSLTENHGTTPVTTDATMFAWYYGYANARDSLDAGYKIISMEDQETYIVPGGGYYSNQFGRSEYLYNNWVPNNNAGWAGNSAPDGHPGVVGGQFAVWNDYTGNGISVNDVSYRLQHNLYTIAEKNWAANERKSTGVNYKDLQKMATELGDAPNADFLYKDSIVTENNEVMKLDDALTNDVAAHTGLNITNHKNITEHTAGKNGEAIAFNGNDSYIQTDKVSTGFDWTSAMWLKLDNDNPDNAVLMEGKTGVLRIEDGKIKYDVEQYTHEFDYVIPKDTWTHVALSGTYEGVKLYINGEVIDELKDKPYPNYNFDSGCNSWNGNYPQIDGKRTVRYYQTLMLPLTVLGSKTNAVKAVVDEFQIYNKVLTEAEISVLAGKAPTENFVNLALNKAVSASGNETANFTAEKAVDGDAGTRWSSNASDTAWFYVDLGSNKNINNVKITWEDAYAKQYKLLVSSDNVTYEEVYNESDGKGGTSDIKFDMKNARYVKFQGVKRRTDNIWITGYSFFEFEVYGDETDTKPKQNVAYNKPVTTTYFNDSGIEADRSGKNAVDANLETRWEFKQNRTDANTIAIPLNSDEDVNKIQITERLWGSETTRIKNIKINAITGDTTKEILAETVYAPSETPSGNPRLGMKEIIFDTVKADRIEITLTPKAAGPDDLVNISEIAMYGTKTEGSTPPEPPIEDHYVLIPHSTMSVFASDEHPNVGVEGLAAFAIDDNAGTWWHTNYSNHKGLPQSITLDLNTVKTIGRYTYLPRSSGTNGNITSYELQISLDNVTYKKVAEGNWANSAAEKVITFDAENARYVRLIAKAGVGNFASAAELNVYTTDTMTKAGLQNTIDAAEALKLDLYLESSKLNLAAAINNAKEIVSKEATEEEIMNANVQLVVALNELLLKGDKDALITLYDSKKDVKQEDYVLASFTSFKEILDNIKVMIDSEEELSQKAIDEVMQELDKAEDELISIKALRAYIIDAENISLIDCDEVSANVLRTALATAKTVIENDNASLYDVMKAQYDLQDALAELIADSTALKTLIERYEQNKDMYTPDSWEEFQAALQAAKDVANDDEATINDLYQARMTLEEQAELILKEKSDTSFSKELLKKAIDKVVFAEEQGKLDKLAPSIAAMIRTRLQEAQDVYKDITSTNDAVLEAWLNLADAMHYLDFVADKTDLKALIELCEKIDLSDYQSGVKAFEDAFAYAKEVYANDKVLQDTINEAFTRLNDALDGLIKVNVDKTLLQQMISRIVYNIGDGSKYRPDDNWNQLQAVLERANRILNNADATQDEVNQILFELTNAYENIRLLPDEAMLNDLRIFLQMADAMDARAYRGEHYAYVQNIRAKAAALLNDFDEAAYKALQKEMKKAYDIIAKEKLTKPELKPGSQLQAKPGDQTNTSDATNVAGLLLITIISGCVLMLARKKSDA